MEARPLKLDRILSATGWQKFTADAPFIGLYASVKREWVKELKTRTADDLVAWGEDPVILRTYAALSSLIAANLKWPNGLFLPEDASGAVLFESSIDMMQVETFMEMERVFGVDVPIDETGMLKFGELVSRIAKLRAANK